MSTDPRLKLHMDDNKQIISTGQKNWKTVFSSQRTSAYAILTCLDTNDILAYKHICKNTHGFFNRLGANKISQLPGIQADITAKMEAVIAKIITIYEKPVATHEEPRNIGDNHYVVTIDDDCILDNFPVSMLRKELVSIRQQTSSSRAMLKQTITRFSSIARDYEEYSPCSKPTPLKCVQGVLVVLMIGLLFVQAYREPDDSNRFYLIAASGFVSFLIAFLSAASCYEFLKYIEKGKKITAQIRHLETIFNYLPAPTEETNLRETTQLDIETGELQPLLSRQW